MRKLKSCPHCGGEPYVSYNVDILAGAGNIIIYCCSSMSEGYVLPTYEKNSKNRVRKTLISRWNKRVKR